MRRSVGRARVWTDRKRAWGCRSMAVVDGVMPAWVLSRTRGNRACRRLLVAVTVWLGAILALAAPAAADIYWTAYNSPNTYIGHASSAGTNSNPKFITLTGDAFGLVAVQGNYIYFVDAPGAPNSGCDFEGGSSKYDCDIGRANVNGTGVNPDFISTTDQDLQGLVVTPTNIYWSALNGGGVVGGAPSSIGEASISGGSVNNNFITGQSAYEALAGYDGHLYWIGSTGNTYHPTIGRATFSGGSVDTDLASVPNGDGVALAVGADGIYFSAAGAIGHTSLNGSSINESFITEAHDGGGTHGLALDSTYLYWATEASAATIARSKLDGSGINTSFIKPSNTAGGSLGGVAVTGSTAHQVSGTVYGQQCDVGCKRVGLPDQRILVTGRAADGSEVSQTDVSGSDGSWSVMVPNGSYEAGPTFDGKVIEGAGFDPEQIGPITVNGADVPGQEFTTCDESSGASGDLVGGLSATDAGSGGSSDVCESTYSFVAGASIHQRTFVDPAPLAPYAPHPDGQGYRADNADPQWAGHLPQCSKFATADPDTTHLKWSSYYLGGRSIGTATVKLTYNNWLDRISLAGQPTVATGSVTRVFTYQKPGEKPGECTLPGRIAPIAAVQITDKHAFQIVISWMLPFDARGFEAHNEIPKVPLAATALHHTVHQVADEVPGFEHLPEKWQDAIVYVVTETIEHKGIHYLTHASAQKIVPQLIETEIAYEKKFNLAAGAYDFVVSQAEEKEGYHAMTMVIRGELEHGPCPPNYKVGKSLPSNLRFCEDTQLAFDASTDHFPDYTLKILRNGKTVPPTTNTLPPQSVFIDPGAKAATLPEVYNTPPIGEPGGIGEARGGEPFMKDLSLAMQFIEPGALQALAGTTDFAGTPKGETPFCVGNHGLGPGTPTTRCYTWLDASP